jgi:hypothetical protein
MASELITSPWGTIFERFISSARKELLISVPFYSKETVKFILTKAGNGVSKRFLLALSENAVRTGVQSTAAIRMMREDKTCSVQFIKNTYKQLEAEIPFSELNLGDRAHSHRDLIRLDDNIRAAFNKAKREAGDV